MIVITTSQLLQMVEMFEVSEEAIRDNFIVSYALPLYIKPPTPDVYISVVPKEQSWQAMNKGKLSKKQRRVS